jgi:hypothetical protein
MIVSLKSKSNLCRKKCWFNSKKTVLKSMKKFEVEKPYTVLENRCTGERLFRARFDVEL